MLKFIVVLYRRPDLTPDEFRSILRGDHGDMAEELPGLRGYAQNHVAPDPSRAHPGWDAVVELVWDDRESMESAWASPAGRRATEHLAEFVDLEKSSWSVVDEERRPLGHGRVTVDEGPRASSGSRGPPAGVRIVDLATRPPEIRRAAAELLVDGFDEPRGWPRLEDGIQEVEHVLHVGFARVALDGLSVLGWVGGLPEYDGRVWELHPLVVRRDHRRRGIGRALVGVFEAEAAKRGALTATLGTDDDTGMTSLAGIDLYADIARHIAGLRDLGRNHPFVFYRRLGYVVTGVMPDANGPGRPDIYMSKSMR